MQKRYFRGPSAPPPHPPPCLYSTTVVTATAAAAAAAIDVVGMTNTMGGLIITNCGRHAESDDGRGEQK